MKQLGIWLDKDKALIVSLENKNENLTTMPSNMEHYHIHGGSGTRFKGGPQDVVQDSKYLEREKHQFRAYFKEIISKVKDADALVVFGPAQTPEKFEKFLSEQYSELSSRLKGVIKADSMTDNQVIALVRDYFSTSA